MLIKESTLRRIIREEARRALLEAPASPVAPAAAGSTSPGVLQAMTTGLSNIASMITVDSLCAPSLIPLWVYPFMNFLVLRKTPLVLTNAVYLQSLRRINECLQQLSPNR